MPILIELEHRRSNATESGGASETLTSLCGKTQSPRPILLAFLDSSRLDESSTVFSFVFELEIEILAKILTERWRGLASPVPTPMN